jgi:hypothetical protein
LSSTVTVKAQVLVLPLESIARQITAVTPLLNLEPLVGVQMTGTAPPQPSIAVGLVQFTAAVQEPASAIAVMLDGHALRIGGDELTTVTVKTQVLVLPLESFARQITVVTPLLNREPFVGVQVTGTTPPQPSIAVGLVQFTAAVQEPASAIAVMLDGHALRIGGDESTTVTVKTQVLVLPLESFARQITVVTPLLNREPFVGVQVTGTTPSQASIAIGLVHVTEAVQASGSAAFVMLAGHPLNAGGDESTMVTVNAQVLVLPLESFARQITVVTPLLNLEPLVGVQVTGTAPSQPSIAVGLIQVTTAAQAPVSATLVMFAGHPLNVGGDESTRVSMATALVSPLAPAFTIA